MPSIFSRWPRAAPCIFVGFVTAAAGGASSGQNAHQMTKTERATFLRLTCRNAKPGVGPGVYGCSRLIGYPRVVMTDDFQLSTVAYGGFTRAGADQAYVTYYTLLEPHMDNFGGGILFDRSGDGWKLMRWYPGGQMDRCVALPSAGRLRMLCLSAYTQMGELVTMVSVRAVPVSARESWDSAVPIQGSAGSDVFHLLIRADDTRNVNPVLFKASQNCGAPSEYRARVLSIDTLRRSTKTGFFAESEATYVTPKQDYGACKTGSWAKVTGEKTTIYYAFKNGEVKVDSPVAIGEPRA